MKGEYEAIDCDSVRLPYTVMLEVFNEGEMHTKAFKTDFDIRKPGCRQDLLNRIAAHLADEIGKEMFQVYRPSPIEEIHAEYMRSRER